MSFFAKSSSTARRVAGLDATWSSKASYSHEMRRHGRAPPHDVLTCSRGSSPLLLDVSKFPHAVAHRYFREVFALGVYG